MKFELFTRKLLLIGSAVLTCANVLLGGLLLDYVQAQTSLTEQPPPALNVDHESGRKCGLGILNSKVESDSPVFQIVAIEVENVNKVPIRAFVLEAVVGTTGKTLTNNYTDKYLHPGVREFVEIPLERVNLKQESIVSVQVDYVEFANGQSCGPNRANRAAVIADERRGGRDAVSLMKQLLDKQEIGLSEYLRVAPSDLRIQAPDSTWSEERLNAYNRGYRSVVSILQRLRSDSPDVLGDKLNQLRTFLY